MGVRRLNEENLVLDNPKCRYRIINEVNYE
jgi:hypothetical protein